MVPKLKNSDIQDWIISELISRDPMVKDFGLSAITLKSIIFKHQSIFSNSLRIDAIGHDYLKHSFEHWIFKHTKNLPEKSKYIVVLNQKSKMPWLFNNREIILYDPDIAFTMSFMQDFDVYCNSIQQS